MHTYGNHVCLRTGKLHKYINKYIHTYIHDCMETMYVYGQENFINIYTNTYIHTYMIVCKSCMNTGRKIA